MTDVMPLPDAVLFDMDGLLIDTEQLSWQCFSDTLIQLGLTRRDEIFLGLIGTNEKTHLEILQRHLGDELDVDKFWIDWNTTYHKRLFSDTVAVKKGALNLLNWLVDMGIARAVATSSATGHAHKMLEGTGLLPYFSNVIGGDQVSNSKPHPEIYEMAAAAISVDCSRAVGLEDSFNGVRSAVAAGLTVIQVPDLLQPTDELRLLGHRVCDDLDDVLSLLSGNSI